MGIIILLKYSRFLALLKSANEVLIISLKINKVNKNLEIPKQILG